MMKACDIRVIIHLKLPVVVFRFSGIIKCVMAKSPRQKAEGFVYS